VPAVIVVMVVVLAAAATVIATRHPSPPVTQTAAAKPQQGAPPATSSVDVTASATPAIVEGTTTTPPTTATPATPAPHAPPPSVVTETTSSKSASGGGGVSAATTTEVASPAPEPRADALFATAMSELAAGDPQQARKTLHRVLQQDPHYAKAHYQMGEIALFNRNFKYAAEELEIAVGDSDRLDPREQGLARLSLALASRDHSESTRLGDEIASRWPEDPDLTRMRATFPGMFNEVLRERGRRRQRP
jgi:hypothetical protein